MIDKITIPVANPRDGRCGYTCPFHGAGDPVAECGARMSEEVDKWYARPGPECIPGDYAVLPADELTALRADSKQLEEILTARMNHATVIGTELITRSLAGKEKAK